MLDTIITELKDAIVENIGLKDEENNIKVKLQKSRYRLSKAREELRDFEREQLKK